MEYSIGIIGAGPCGCSSAINILKNSSNFSVTIFEKESIHKDKTCGDGITELSFNLLESIGINKNELKSFGYNISEIKNYDSNFNLKSKSSGFYTIKRTIFDNYLREKVLKNNGQILYDTNIEKIEVINNKVHVFSNKDKFIFDSIIISTGINLNLIKKNPNSN